MTKRLLLTALLLPYLSFSQTSKTQVQPDCGPINFVFTSTGSSTQLNNVTNGAQCQNWTLTYSSTGFSALSISLQFAPDSAGSPGSWSDATATTGSNPSTATTFANLTASGTSDNASWLRANLGSVTGSGTVTGAFYGFRNGTSGSGGGGGGGCSSPCPVVGTAATGAAPSGDPVQVAGLDGAGNILPLQSCTKSATFSTAASGNTQLIAASGSTVVRVCHWDLTPTSTVNIKLTQGTGSNCGTGTADLTGLLLGVLALAMDYGPQSALLGTAGHAICLNLSSAVQTSGTIIYAQY